MPKKITTKSENKSEAVYYISAKEYSLLDSEQRKKWTPVKAKYEKIPIFCIISAIITIISIIIYVLFCISESFADFFNRYISMYLRLTLAKISNLLPISIAELIIILIPIIVFLTIWYLLKFRCETRKSSLSASLCVLSVAGLFLSSFVLCFAAGYRAPSLDKKLNIESKPVSAKELFETAEYLTEKINELTPNIDYGDDGFSIMPYGYKDMNDKLITAYDKFCENHDFIINFKSNLKPVFLSEGLSYMHITGVYTFFTGEANLNIGFPDYSIPYTAAHELAHQRGIAREDEANMIAFLVCIESEDPYIQYCAYTNMYEYVTSALYKADRELYREIRSKTNEAFTSEQIAFSKFFDKYEKSVASQVSGAVNDAYLVSQGTVGQVSYGMVVDLTVAYFKQLDIID